MNCFTYMPWRHVGEQLQFNLGSKWNWAPCQEYCATRERALINSWITGCVGLSISLDFLKKMKICCLCQEIGSQFHSCPAHILVTVLTTLSHLQNWTVFPQLSSPYPHHCTNNTITSPELNRVFPQLSSPYPHHCTNNTIPSPELNCVFPQLSSPYPHHCTNNTTPSPELNRVFPQLSSPYPHHSTNNTITSPQSCHKVHTILLPSCGHFYRNNFTLS